MAELNKNKELSMADVIVGQATSVPTADTSRRKTRGIMGAKQEEARYSPMDPEASLPDFVRDHLNAIRELRTPEDTETPGLDFFQGQDIDATVDTAIMQDARKKDSLGAKSDYGDRTGGSVVGDFDANVASLQESSGDPAFKKNVEVFASKYNITPKEVYAVIDGENKDWSWTTTNSLGYKGLFQIGKTPAGEAGIDYANLTNMKPSQQLNEYAKYLDRWDYDGSVPLAIMQAAPGKAASLKDKPDSAVVYAVGSDEWEANKPWRSSNDGPVTLGSLKAYYK